MPFYDYKCGKCGKTFEVLHGMAGRPAGLKCEFCGADEVQRIFHPVATMRAGAGSSVPSGSSCSSCSSGTCGSCGH